MTRLLRLFSLLLALSLSLSLGAAATAQESAPAPAPATDPDRSATGGAQTLEDILARQRGESIDDSFRSQAIGDPEAAAAETAPLGTLGGASDPELWRALRYNRADIRASNDGPAATVLFQDGGMRWLEFRAGPLITWGGYLLLGTLAALAVFLLLRGRIKVDGAYTGIRIERFKAVERFGHWLIAGSFIVLGVTGLLSLFGRKFLIPTFGHEVFSDVAIVSKWVHDNVSWAFMLGLVLVFVMWVAHNIPNRHDLKWLAMGGGIFSKHHAPAKKFNAGQKLIFWAVIILGLSISASGLSLLFPFEIPMFAKSFNLVNDTGLLQWAGYGPLPTELAPHEEMQLSQLWHAIVAFIFMAVILAHIYLGTVGMQGAYDAMGKGDVELQWAREHHNLWVEELAEKGKIPAGAAHGAHPAE